MEKLKIILFAFLLIGCSSQYDRRLLDINELANVNQLDSAYSLLLDIDINEFGTLNQHYYRLLKIKIDDKRYKDISSDTTYIDIINFFKQYNNYEILGEAFYYGGRINRELGDAPAALYYFQESYNVLSNTLSTNLKGKVLSQMGQIFYELYMFEQAKDKFKEAIICQEQGNDSIGLMYDYRDLAKTYNALGIIDSVKCNLQKSIDISSNYNCNRFEIETRSNLIEFYIRNLNYADAIKEYIKIKPLMDLCEISDYVRMNEINICIITKEYDKLEGVLYELLKSESLQSKSFASGLLADISSNRKNYRQANKFLRYKMNMIDTINHNASRDALIYQNSFYNYSLKEKEVNNLTNQRMKILTISLIVIVFLLLITILILVVYWVVKTKNIRLGVQNKTLIMSNANLSIQNEELSSKNIYLHELNNELVSSNDELILENDRINADLLQQLSVVKLLEKENEELKNGLFEYSNCEKHLSDNIRNTIFSKIKLIDINDKSLSDTFVNSSVLMKFKNSVYDKSVKITSEDWHLLDDLINQEYPNFKKRILLLNNQLREEEYRVAMLVKCKLLNTEISEILCYERSNVQKIRVRMFKKLFLVDGKAVDFDKFIYSL